jgi:hypothetical protein
MDLSTAKDLIEDMMGERDQLFQRIRQLEARSHELEKRANYWHRIAERLYVCGKCDWCRNKYEEAALNE